MADKIKAITGKKGARLFDLTADEANSDFIRSGRLATSDKKEDKEKLKKMSETEMIS